MLGFLIANKIVFLIGSLLIFIFTGYIKITIDESLFIYKKNNPHNLPSIKRNFLIQELLGFIIIIAAAAVIISFIVFIFY